MKKQDLVSILITFAFGVFGGGYLYLTGFAPLENKVSLPDVVALSQFVLVSDTYGGCRDNCPSFQVVNDGSYRYLYVPTDGTGQVVRQGTLPSSIQRKLKSVLDPEKLSAQAESIQPTSCNSFSDGVDVVYDITLAGEQYILDSCGTAVDRNSELWLTLRSIWEYLQTL
ncbi:hypothetical protein H6785_03555 [Candidatus Nomurabacteria bacterium]|nr:hypothetical protein [Candidatus Nomurabacteria bacterium]